MKKMNFKSISPYQRLDAEDHVSLALFHNFKHGFKKIKDMPFTEHLIQEYNNCLKNQREFINFQQYCSQIKAEERSQKFINSFEEKPWEHEKPVIWNDRQKSPYYIQNLEGAHKYEVYIENLFKKHGIDIGLFYGKDDQYSGESKLGVEIKYDKKLHETGNVYIEYQERMTADQEWVNSGIHKEDNTKLFLIGDYDKFFIFPKSELNKLQENLSSFASYGVMPKGNNHKTSKGFIIPGSFAKEISLDIEKAVEFLCYHHNIVPDFSKKTTDEKIINNHTNDNFRRL